MQSRANNPPTNAIPSGINENDILAAVAASGYPLQTQVATYLKGIFSIQEEWSYLDTATKELRSIDVFASTHIGDPAELGRTRVRPKIALLVECKRSSLPYVFFSSAGSIIAQDCPLFAGLRSDVITLTTDDAPDTWALEVMRLFDLREHPFINSPPSIATTFTRCARKGAALELSGSEAFNGLIHPVVKAMDHFKVSSAPAATHVYFDLHLVVGIGVLDAPMIVVSADPSTGPVLSPWIRVFRHEYDDDVRDRCESERMYGIDVVHKDYLESYVRTHLMPFATLVGGVVPTLYISRRFR